MTLHAIVAALGGDLYAGGLRANVPAPGHSAADRSVSLLLDGNRLVIHGFGAADWTVMRADLVRRGLVDARGRLAGEPVQGRADPSPRPDRLRRVRAAAGLWSEAGPLTPACLSSRHLGRRAVLTDPAALCGLRHHPAAPVSVLKACGPRRPALLAGVTSATGELTAVEIVYLDAGGGQARYPSLSRKTVGVLPPGSAVRLGPVRDSVVAGEGVMTVLSAAERFGRPGWAALSAHNLARWFPPAPVRDVLIAVDRGPVGEAAAARLKARLADAGLAVRCAAPPEPFGDWNEAAMADRRGKEGR